MISCRKRQGKNVGISLILLKIRTDLNETIIYPFGNVLLICGGVF